MNYFYRLWGALRRTLTTRGAFAPRPVRGNVAVTALRAGVCVALPLLALHAAGRIDLAPYAAMGCFTALYARDDTYARRARLLAVVGATLTLAVALGALVSAALPHPLAAITVVALVAGGAKYLSDALEFGAPAGLMFVFAAGVAAYNPQPLTALPVVAATTAAAAALCWALALVGALVHPTAPERLAVARALHALARHLRHPAPPPAPVPRPPSTRPGTSCCPPPGTPRPARPWRSSPPAPKPCSPEPETASPTPAPPPR